MPGHWLRCFTYYWGSTASQLALGSLRSRMVLSFELAADITKTLGAPCVTCIHFLLPLDLLEKTYKDMLSSGSRALVANQTCGGGGATQLSVSSSPPIFTNINHGAALPFSSRI